MRSVPRLLGKSGSSLRSAMSAVRASVRQRRPWVRVLLWALLVVAVIASIGVVMYTAGAGHSVSTPASHSTQAPVQSPTN